SALTVAYSARLLWGGFADKRRGDVLSSVPPPAHGPGPGQLVPAALLAVVTLAAGVVPALVSDLLVGAGRSLDADLHTTSLALWHGVNPALGLSALAIGIGALMFVSRGVVAQLAHA